MEPKENKADDKDVPEILDNDSDVEDEEFLWSFKCEVMDKNDDNWDSNRKQEGGKVDIPETQNAVPIDKKWNPQ